MPRRRSSDHEDGHADETPTGWDSSPAADDEPVVALSSGPADADDENTVDAPAEAAVSKGSAHRPSRRHLIVKAAVRVFSRKGFAETSIQEIAEAAGMVPTAVYYHFASKEELFESALGYAMDASSAAAQHARPDDAEADADTFKSVIDAVWDWTAEHPNAARMLFLQMAGGATPGTRLLTKEYEDRHIRRAFDYFPVAETPANKRSAAAQQAARSLRVRTMIATTIAIQPLRIEGGPLAGISVPRLRAATTEVCSKMIEGR
ncbi:TetR/AcrR family transcriptional regulator [Rhodococcoides fascians]|uniref:TetR/AcrR family transcriptional regulator n=1 Tax=Rhodococcoides fascians TaxID=1828 RepID=UPI00050C62E7|nr:TetR/AcrR family transcriptional regulator [Rhodococcus fascians]